jgi:nicotinate phosphoribosyltransferase
MALFTDAYELAMGESYLREGVTGEATFSLFTRQLPENRSYLVAAGLDDVMRLLRSFRFSRQAVQHLRSLERFDQEYLNHRAQLRFTGDVWAVSEGTVVFADEPLLEVTAPIIEAQLLEPIVLNLCHLQTLLATKASRTVLAAAGRPIIEFGLRRSHGIDAAMKAARCAYLAGAAATSNVLAGREYGIPTTGTMAHSYVTAFPDELSAFRAFARAFPADTVLLIDTYDTLQGARLAAHVAREMAERGERLRGVRLDSGDLGSLSRGVRVILDHAGFPDVQIFASGGLDEWSVRRLVASRAPIDAFGVGTRMDVSEDAPSLDMAYKLVRYGDQDVLKLSANKATRPGRKQVYRFRDAKSRFASDVIATRSEPPPEGGEPLLHRVFRHGRRTGVAPRLQEIRRHCANQIAALPDGLRQLDGTAPYAVKHTDSLRHLEETLGRRVRVQGSTASSDGAGAASTVTVP